MRSLRLPKSRVRSLSTYEILGRKFSFVSDLGQHAARPGRYSTDRPACTVLVSGRGDGSIWEETPLFARRRGPKGLFGVASDELHRVDLPAVLEHLEVHVGARRSAGGADIR